VCGGLRPPRATFYVYTYSWFCALRGHARVLCIWKKFRAWVCFVVFWVNYCQKCVVFVNLPENAKSAHWLCGVAA
jgi:hypothetical protein